MSKKDAKQIENNVLNININPDKRAEVVEAMSRFLATTYTLYVETLNYHWNVTGEHFVSLHALFETQYDDLRCAGDDIAERIRALGAICPGTYRQFGQLSAIKEPESLPKGGLKMVEQLLKQHEIASREAQATLKIAEAAGDDVSVDMMVARITVHDKTAWMLRSIVS